MSTRLYGDTQVEVDAEGYLIERDAWTPDIGEAIARELGIRLGALHWRVISGAREEHAAHGRPPSLRAIAAAAGVTQETIHALFPHPARATITRVSGIPRGHAPRPRAA